MIVGVTGGIGSGKSLVVEFFSKFKEVAIYIADVEAKKLMTSSVDIKNKLIAEFGTDCYLNNQLNKPFISKLVFNNKEQLDKLNAIVHPVVKQHFQNFVLENKDKAYIVYENAILFETQSNLNCDFIITVFSDLNTRIKRVIQRDSTTKKEVLSRIKNQWKEDKKLLQSNYVIYNDIVSNTKLQVNKIHNILTEKSILF